MENVERDECLGPLGSPGMTGPDIRGPGQIDAGWMTQVLARRGLDATVARVDVRPVGTGQVGDCTRISIEYAGSPGPAPRTMIGKFPAANPDSRRAGVAGGDYLREVRFYRDLAPTTLVSAPKCHLAVMDEETGDFVLLLEDLAPARQGDQLEGVTVDQARLVVDEAARLHAPFWGDPAIAGLDWIKQTPAARHALPPPDAIEHAAQGFCARFSNVLSNETVRACLRYAQRVEVYRALPRKAKTIAHYDFRPDNMMFASPQGGRPVSVLDWQTLSYAAGADDLAYFLAGALPPETLERHESELLERYLSELQLLGVDDYSADDLRDDYVIGAFRLLATGMGAAMAVSRTERGDRMFVQMVNAAAAHIARHDALARLD